ncbi:VOC family protein [Jatrophihabitans cynanchi]|uniref:VOC family protein n=1 Tax=Jatrophihabitans cynanchi TaxID=2944128 RepID=UPI0022B23188|nr:VOC family protein [Jatrophihabitans sp. SB3-54]
MTDAFPVLNSVVLDTTDARGLAEFYRQLLGYEYRAGDETPRPASPTRPDTTG